MAKCCTVPANATLPATLACPNCGGRSKRVGLLTVKSLAKRLPFGGLSDTYYFCDAPGCEVVYFSLERGVGRLMPRDLLVPVSQKDSNESLPVCYCFGVTRRDIREEIEESGKSSFPERIRLEVKAGHCACEVKNPSGKCCLGNVNAAALQFLRPGEKAQTDRLEVKRTPAGSV